MSLVRFELTTYGFGGRCAVQLRHRDEEAEQGVEPHLRELA